MSWQPIETAPQIEWAPVLVSDGERSGEGWLVEADSVGDDDWQLQWWWLDENRVKVRAYPKVWMPLPDPPDKVDPGIPMYRMRKD